MNDFFQDLALLAQDPVLTTQAAELLALLGGQAVSAAAGIEISLHDPVPQGLIGDPQILGDLPDRLAGLPDVVSP